jgi:hypothetical protein
LILFGSCAGFSFRNTNRGSRLDVGHHVNQQSVDGEWSGREVAVRRIEVGGRRLVPRRSQVQITDAQKDGLFIFRGEMDSWRNQGWPPVKGSLACAGHFAAGHVSAEVYVSLRDWKGRQSQAGGNNSSTSLKVGEQTSRSNNSFQDKSTGTCRTKGAGEGQRDVRICLPDSALFSSQVQFQPR